MPGISVAIGVCFGSRRRASPLLVLRTDAACLHWIGDGGATYVTPGTGGVASWLDLAGSRHLTQATEDDRPELIAAPAIRFDKDDATDGDAMALPVDWITGAAAATLVACIATPDTVTVQHLLACDNTDLLLRLGANTLRVQVGGANYAQIPWTYTDPTVVVVRFDGAGADNAARLRLFVSGVEIAPTYFGAIPATIPALSAGQIGRNGATTGPSDVDYYLLAGYASALPAADLLVGGKTDNALRSLLAVYP